MVKVAGLWLREGKKGKFFAGTLGGASILVMKNRFKKEGDNKPDYEVYIAENKPRPQAQAQQPAQAPAKTIPNMAPQSNAPVDDDLPF